MRPCAARGGCSANCSSGRQPAGNARRNGAHARRRGLVGGPAAVGRRCVLPQTERVRAVAAGGTLCRLPRGDPRPAGGAGKALRRSAPVYRPPVSDLWRVQDAIAQMRRLLAESNDVRPLAAILPAIPADATHWDLRCRAAITSTLMAGLELARAGALTAEQSEAGGPIRFGRLPGSDGVRTGRDSSSTAGGCHG